jgi:signal transduction histidine kinase/ActR/RegA family two-component response regulator
MQQESRRLRIAEAEIRLLYANAKVGVGVTLIAATILAYLQWPFILHSIILSWWLYMVAVSAARYTLAQIFWLSATKVTAHRKWGNAFAIGSGLAGSGWGAAGILLTPEGHLTNEVLLVFVLGGMMLGAVSVLAPRPEAYLAFLVPAGIGPAIRQFLTGDDAHAAMGLLCAVFTMATIVITTHIHRTIESALGLQFENQDLVEELKAAKYETEALNQQLERRVEERTGELHQSNDRLRAEIEQREKVEEELLQARKLEAIGVLAGGIAHDFNNFLTVIQGNIEFIKRQLRAGNRVDEQLERIESACQRATALSTQLLTFAKGGAPVRRVVSIYKLIRDSIDLARAGSSVSFDVTIAEDLWSAEVDPGQISQVLHNILLNARQSMSDTGIIEVTAENVAGDESAQQSTVRISIRDYGCGIPEENIPRIFDPYFTTKPSGTGLGLATTYAIVAKHGGHIRVESNAGVGTVFIIDLPATQEHSVPEAGAPGSGRGGGERVLVMDDEEAIRKLLEDVLKRLGYQAASAADGAEAVALYETAFASGVPFDAVILDLTVSGGMGGVEAAAKIRELNSSARLIVSSGYSDSEALSDYRRFGFDDVIPKPWAIAEVGRVMRRVLVSDRNKM